jgi:hypothetical protein
MAAACASAMARGGHSGHGHGGGGYDSLYRSEHISNHSAGPVGEAFAPWYPPPPYWYYEPTVATPSYLLRKPEQQGSWYRCKASGIHYPYAGACAKGWVEEAPALR